MGFIFKLFRILTRKKWYYVSSSAIHFRIWTTDFDFDNHGLIKIEDYRKNKVKYQSTLYNHYIKSNNAENK